MLPVSSIQDYLSIRKNEHHVALVESARQGHTEDKRRLTQFNYSCIPGENGLLRGCKTPSNSVGMDIDFDDADEQKIKATIKRQNRSGLRQGCEGHNACVLCYDE